MNDNLCPNIIKKIHISLILISKIEAFANRKIIYNNEIDQEKDTLPIILFHNIIFHLYNSRKHIFLCHTEISYGQIKIMKKYLRVQFYNLQKFHNVFKENSVVLRPENLKTQFQ